MKTVALPLQTRQEKGSSASRRARRDRKIPANIYGLGRDPVMAWADASQVRQGGFSYDRQSLVQYELNGQSQEKGLALLRELQVGAVDESPIHLDLQRIDPSKPLHTEIGIRVVGQAESPGVVKGGTVEMGLHSIEVEALPDSLPEVLEVDISTLDLGHSIHVSNLTPPQGVKFLEEAERTVIIISTPSALAAEVTKAETAEGAEGEAKEGEAGEKAEGDAKKEEAAPAEDAKKD